MRDVSARIWQRRDAGRAKEAPSGIARREIPLCASRRVRTEANAKKRRRLSPLGMTVWVDADHSLELNRSFALGNRPS
jgi:hypothetical protein